MYIVKHRLHVCPKVNTALQFLLIAVSLGAPVLGLQHHPSLHYLWAATGATTFLSAVSYAFMKVLSGTKQLHNTIVIMLLIQDTYKFSHKPYDHQFGKKLTAFILFILFNIGFTLSFPSQVKTGAFDAEEAREKLHDIMMSCPLNLVCYPRQLFVH